MKTQKDEKKFSLVKVNFYLGKNLWHGHETESLWAEKISENRCRLRNTPFFAQGISFEDIVFVKSENGSFWFDKVSIVAGHSTYRIIVDSSLPEEVFWQYWQPLVELGCTYESIEGKQRLLAVDVPPAADIYKVYSLLEKGESNSAWDFEEGHCGHMLTRNLD